MIDCLFCKIAAGEIPCDEIYSDEDFLAFRDINPQAPVHFLVIPRRHVSALTDLETTDDKMMGQLQVIAANLAAAEGVAGSGFRFVINCGQDACQSVPHLHLHVLGGRQLDWPPG